MMHQMSKHIDTKLQFIREKVVDNSFQLVYTPTDQLEADLLTESVTSTSESGATSQATICTKHSEGRFSLWIGFQFFFFLGKKQPIRLIGSLFVLSELYKIS